MTGSRTPAPPCRSSAYLKTAPDNHTPAMLSPFPIAASIASSSPASRPFVLAALRGLRLDTDCGCRTAPRRRERPEKRTHQAITDLTDPALSGMTSRTEE